MAFLKLSLFLFVLVHVFVLFSHPVHCSDEDENNVLQGINSYRQSLNLPALAKNGNAGCLADEIADDLEDEPCTSANNGANIVPGATSKLANFPKYINKCKIDANTTVDGVIMPVCVPKLVPTLVLTNYTHSKYAKYLNSSKYTGVGLGSEDDWMVVVLSTNTPGGSFANAGSLVSKAGLGHSLVSLTVLFALFFGLLS